MIHKLLVDIGGVGGLLAIIHLILGVIGNQTGNKNIQGLDDVITAILKAFFPKQTTPTPGGTK